MSNLNDAEITALYVSAVNAPGIQDDVPNAPAVPGAPIPAFDVTLEMVAGGGLGTGAYTLSITCSNVSDTVPASAVLVPGGPLNGLHSFGTPPWVLSAPGLWTFDQRITLKIPAGAGNKVYQYTAALVSANNQVVSIKQSDLFILV
jgi:hypothetical protein